MTHKIGDEVKFSKKDVGTREDIHFKGKIKEMKSVYGRTDVVIAKGAETLNEIKTTIR